MVTDKEQRRINSKLFRLEIPYTGIKKQAPTNNGRKEIFVPVVQRSMLIRQAIKLFFYQVCLVSKAASQMGKLELTSIKYGQYFTAT
jgi:hypothetical protein